MTNFNEDMNDVLLSYKERHTQSYIDDSNQKLLNKINEVLNSDVKVGLTVRELYRQQFKLNVSKKVEDSLIFRLTLPYRNKVTVSVGFYKEYPVLEKLNSLVHEYWNNNNNARLLIDEEYQLYFSRRFWVDDAFNWVNLTGETKHV